MKKNYCDSEEALEHIGQKRSCGCPIPGTVYRQAERGSEKPTVVEGAPDHGRGLGTR